MWLSPCIYCIDFPDSGKGKLHFSSLICWIKCLCVHDSGINSNLSIYLFFPCSFSSSCYLNWKTMTSYHQCDLFTHTQNDTIANHRPNNKETIKIKWHSIKSPWIEKLKTEPFSMKLVIFFLIRSNFLSKNSNSFISIYCWTKRFGYFR